jgi:hypothetical protein
MRSQWSHKAPPTPRRAPTRTDAQHGQQVCVLDEHAVCRLGQEFGVALRAWVTQVLNMRNRLGRSCGRRARPETNAHLMAALVRPVAET